MTEPFTVTAATLLEGLSFGEGPRWHQGRLWYSDFFSRAVWSVEPDGSERRLELEVPGRPSGLGWLPDGRLLVVSMDEKKVVRREDDGSSSLHADLSPFAPHETNDMVVLEDGTCFVGQFGFDLLAFFRGMAEPQLTSLLRVDIAGDVEVAAGDLSFPNGMVRFGSTLVVAETFAMRLSAFRLRDDRTLDGRRVWAGLDGCFPDGICGDAGGAVWVANAAASECIRVGEGGHVLARVETSQPCYACTLGGEDRRTLFCCTAPSSDADLVETRRDGRIEVARVEVPGAGTP